MGDTGKGFGRQFQAGQTRTPPTPMGAPSRGTAMPSTLPLRDCEIAQVGHKVDVLCATVCSPEMHFYSTNVTMFHFLQSSSLR